ncbi:MAG: hypothetical protein IJ190_04425 [Prevotella sp.]|nr:hypothetical protein [Prevotella sp.]
MKEKELTYHDAPSGYQLCFNSNCSKAKECLHYQVALLAPPTKTAGAAIYPSAWKDGDCQYFRTCKPVRMAYGFDNLYRHLPRYLVSNARMRIRNFLSCGMSTYYRYHHGERLMSPQLQQEILDIMARYGSTEGLTFDHYITSYDFT